MVSQDMLNFVMQQLQSGSPRDAIKNTLLTNGWPESDIEEALRQATSPTPTVPTMMHMPKKVLISIGVLGIVAVLLAVAIVKNVPQKEPNVELTVSPVVSTPSTMVPSPPIATEEEALLSSFPDENTSTEKRQEFFAKINRYALDVSEVDITHCAPRPLVVRLKKGSAITFKNNDIVSHTIDYRDSISVEIPSKEAKKSTPVFENTGVSSYACDGRPAGIFSVY